ARANTLLVDSVVLVGEVGVERLRHRPADDRLDLLRQRFELLVAVAEDVRRVDHDLAVQSADLFERVGDCRGGYGHLYRVGIRGVAAIAAEPGDLMARLLPAFGEPATDVALADDRDLHVVLL